MSRKKTGSDFVKYLSQALSESPVWKPLYEKIQVIMSSIIEEKINQLEYLRVPEHIKRGDYIKHEGEKLKVSQVERNEETKTDKMYVVKGDSIIEIPLRALHDRDILINGSSVNGFNYFSNSLEADEYARVYQYIQQYWPYSGDSNFVNFLGFVKGLRLDIYQLWDENTDFDTDSKHKYLERFSRTYNPVYNQGGIHYPTSHVEIEYDYFQNLDFDTNDLINLFYYMAPIHLVLHRIVRGAFVTSRWVSKATGAGHSVETSIFRIKPLFQYRVFACPSISIHTNSTLILDTL